MSSRKDFERLLELTDSYKRTVNSVVLLMVTACSHGPASQGRRGRRRPSLTIAFLAGVAVATGATDSAQMLGLIAAPTGR